MASPLLMTTVKTESTFEQIPIIDLTAAWSTDPVARRELADLIRDACVNVGFFYITNHGIPEAAISTAIDAAKRFFALSTEHKMQLDIHASPNFKGYTALLAENTDPNNAGDLHEGFDIGYEPPPSSSTSSTADTSTHTSCKNTNTLSSGGNVWPDSLPGFKEDVLTYYHAALRLGFTLFPLFALALDMDEDFFADKIKKPAAILRLLHYPPQRPAPSTHSSSSSTSSLSSADSTLPLEEDKVIGIGAHTDYECFTLLYQDASGGLQVKNANGRWIDAVPIPGTIVVNLGDQFARWTNDTFKSTPHRAINTSGHERYSIPLFFGTDYDVLLEPIPTCISDSMPAKYPAITAGEYVKSRLEATYKR